MKLRNMILFFIFTSYTSSLYPQGAETYLRNPGSGKRITVAYIVHELEVTDSIFLKDIDSLLLDSDCPYLKNSANKYFALYITKSNKNSEHYNLVIALYPVPIAEYGNTGYFEYKGYTFFVDENEIVTLFKRKNNKKEFTYKRGEYRVTEEFPMWVFSYKNQRLTLLESTCW